MQQLAVTYKSPVELFVTGIKSVDWQNVCLIAWSVPSEALDHLGQRSNCSSVFLVSTVQRLPWSLDQLSKKTSIAWFTFDLSCKRHKWPLLAAKMHPAKVGLWDKKVYPCQKCVRKAFVMWSAPSCDRIPFWIHQFLSNQRSSAASVKLAQCLNGWAVWPPGNSFFFISASCYAYLLLIQSL